MSRLFGDSIPIEVQVLNGAIPKQFQWNGRRHPVQTVANHWRVDFGWWRLRIWRDYFKLQTTTGLLVTIYCDLTTGEWYLQMIYD